MAKMESSRFALYRDLLLLAKLLAMIGWARDERVRSAIGFEYSCAVAEGAPRAGAHRPRRPRAAGRGRGVRRRDRRLGRRWCRGRRDARRGGTGRAGARVRAVRRSRRLPERSARGDAALLPRRRHDDRDGQARDPGSGRTHRGRHHRDQLRHLLPRPARGARGVARSRGRRLGDGPGSRSTRRRRRSSPSRRLDIETLGRNGQLCAEGARALGASGGPISRNAGRCVQCSSCPLGCRIDAKRAAHVSYLPRAVAAGARVRAGVQVQRVLTEDGRAVGLACRAGMPTTGAQEMRFTRPPQTPRPDQPPPAATGRSGPRR